MQDLTSENVLTSLNKGAFAPFYLFYGPEDFWLEITLDRIKKELIPDSVKDFNLETLYGGEISPQEILNRAHLVPFMYPHRLIIVRGTENFTKNALEQFIPYMESPVDSTCIIWISSKTDLTGVFYKRFKELGRAVNFKKLSERQVYSWLQKRAKELELDINKEASSFIYQIVGSNLRDLFSEIFKLSLRYPNSKIGVEQIKELTTFSRLFTVFDLVDYVSKRDTPHAIVVLSKLFETQGRDPSAALGLLGMLARQIRLILKAKSGLKKGGGRPGAIDRLRPLPNFVIEKCLDQERFWQEEELEDALNNIYDADGLIRTGSKGDLVLENLIFLLCFPR
ncbi:MAG: DNA polymerase III subunit delta [Desulfobacteraceae bacterium]|nr:MAG: DNA polymerase III subunit delta [Desulfobacteraceae bacterium]